PDPFSLRLEHLESAGSHEILPENLEDRHAELRANAQYRVTVEAPSRENLREARLTLCHIRPQYKPQIPWGNLFSNVSVAPNVRADGMRTTQLTITASTPAKALSLELSIPESLLVSGLSPGHSYLWLRVS